MKKLIIHNVRVGGYASNSSSSHSCWVLPSSNYVPSDDYYGDMQFGWNDFTLASRDAKLDYMAVALRDSLWGASDDVQRFILQGLGFNYPIDRDSYIDHQSAFTFPRDWSGATIPNFEFIEDFKKWLLQDNVVILGGNDNSEGHPRFEEYEENEEYHESGILEMLGEQHPNYWVARKDPLGFWTLFNRASGAKLRFSFEDVGTQKHSYFEPSAWRPNRASWPELVDIGITDYCPFNCNFCAPPGTLIQTPQGDRLIETLNVGDIIYSSNPSVRNIVEEAITQTFKRDYEGDLIAIELEDGNVLRLTPNHEVYTQNRGWVLAEDLTEIDILVDIKEYADA